MILDSVILQSFKRLTTPQSGDSRIQIPPVIVPTIELRQPIIFNSGFSSVSQWPAGPENFQEVSTITSWADSRSNQAGAGPVRWIRLAPGLWNLDFFMTTQADYAGVITSNGNQIIFTDEKVTLGVIVLQIRPLPNLVQNLVFTTKLALQGGLEISVDQSGNTVGQYQFLRCILIANRLQ